MTTLLTIFAIISFVFLLVASGYPILRIWLGNQFELNIFGLTAISFAFGLALWTWLTWVGYLVEVNLFLLVGIFLLASLLSYTALYLKKIPLFNSAHFRLERSEWGLLGATFLLMLVYYIVGSFQDPSADSFGHLAFIRKIYEQSIVSVDIFIASSNVPYNLGNGAYAYTAIYPLFAFLAKVFGLDPSAIWLHLPATMSFIYISAVLFLASVILKDRKHVLLFAFFLLISWAMWGHGFRGVGYPNTLSFIMYLVAMGLILAIPSKFGWTPKYILGVVILGASMVLVHSQWWAFLVGSIGLLAFFQIVTRRFHPAINAGIVLGAIGIVSLPLLITKTGFYQIISSELESVLLYRYTEKLFYIGSFYAFNLVEVLTSQHFLIIATSMAFLITLLIRKIELERVYETAFSAFFVLAIALIMINPIAVPIISEIATTTIAARMRNMIRDWGLFPIALLSVLLWPQLKQSFMQLGLATRGVIVVTGVIAIGISIFSQSILTFARGLSAPGLRQQVADFFAQNLGLGESTLRMLYQNLSLIIAGSALLLVILLSLTVIAIRPWRFFKVDMAKITQNRAMPIVLPILVMILVLIVPSSKLSPWSYVRADSTYAGLYGPTLSQIEKIPQIQELFEIFKQGSVVTTDWRKSILAFRDVLISGDVQGEIGDAKQINDYIRPLFDVNTQAADVLERLIELSPDYLVLSPRYSHLAWMKYDAYVGVLNKIYDERIEGIDYYNKRFVVYELDSEAARLAKETNQFEPVKLALQAPPEDCSISRLYGPYAFDLDPRGWNPIGNELIDGTWNTTASSLLWVPARANWFYIEFDLGGAHYIDRVEIKNYHFASSYRLNALRLYASEDRANYHLASELLMDEKHEPGEHVWVFEDVRQNARSVRVAINSQSSTTIGEIEIYGCMLGAN